MGRSKYRELRAVPVLERLAVRRSHIHGWGLYTKVDVSKDDFIIEYVGQVIRNNMGDKREEYYDKAGVGSCYLFRLDEDCIVDATRRGHIGRFINHCCSPNAYAKTVEIGPHTQDRHHRPKTSRPERRSCTTTSSPSRTTRSPAAAARRTARGR